MLPKLKILKTGSTHTYSAFVEFAYDLLDYAVPKYGYPWERSFDFERSCTKVFREGFGDIVMLFQSRNSHDFNRRLSFVCESESHEDLRMFLGHDLIGIFKGEIPLMEVIAYFAFLLDMAVISFTVENPDLIHDLLDDVESVFQQHIEPFFTIVGGWFSLYRVASQYRSYVTFQPKTNPTASVTNEDFVLTFFADIDKF